LSPARAARLGRLAAWPPGAARGRAAGAAAGRLARSRPGGLYS